MQGSVKWFLNVRDDVSKDHFLPLGQLKHQVPAQNHAVLTFPDMGIGPLGTGKGQKLGPIRPLPAWGPAIEAEGVKGCSSLEGTLSLPCHGPLSPVSEYRDKEGSAALEHIWENQGFWPRLQLYYWHWAFICSDTSHYCQMSHNPTLRFGGLFHFETTSDGA